MRASIKAIGRAGAALLAAGAILAAAEPARAQSVQLHGRVAEAGSRAPVPGVRVFAEDSSTAVVTDSLGRFSILVPGARPLVLRAERIGYFPDRFELGEDAAGRLSVLLLRPAAIELEGVEAVAEAAVSKALRDLRRRRNAYFGPVSVFDRAYLERFGRIGTVWDFVRTRTIQVYECFDSLSGLCTRERGRRSLRFGPRELPVLVCIDGRESWGAVARMNSLSIDEVSMIELFRHGRGSIRVYTPGFITRTARSGRSIAPFGDLGC